MERTQPKKSIHSIFNITRTQCDTPIQSEDHTITHRAVELFGCIFSWKNLVFLRAGYTIQNSSVSLDHVPISVGEQQQRGTTWLTVCFTVMSYKLK